jgi:hypothetical protein
VRNAQGVVEGLTDASVAEALAAGQVPPDEPDPRREQVRPQDPESLGLDGRQTTPLGS